MTPVPSYDTAAPNNNAFGVITYGGAYVRHYVAAGASRWYRIQVPSWPASGELTVTVQVQSSSLYATGPASISVYAGQFSNGNPLGSVPASSVAALSTAGPGSPGTTLTVTLTQYSTNWEGPGGYYFLKVVGTDSVNTAYYLLSWDPLTPSSSSSASPTFTFDGAPSASSSAVKSVTMTMTPSMTTGQSMIAIITTVAGVGVGDRGPATSASLYNPTGVSVDSMGNIYIAEFDKNRIRKVDTSGYISTVAGNGVYGYSGDGGPATSASLSSPWRVYVDSMGNIYIAADTVSHRIRKVNTSGYISTVAGDGWGGC
jgi:hypothetical protein